MINKILLRLSIPFVIVILTVLAFKNGVVVADRPELHLQPLSILIFHALNLFTLGAKDLGRPIAGPQGWQVVMFCMYYLAPLVSLTALAEVVYLLGKPFLPLLLLRGGHFVIIGNGRAGKAAFKVLLDKYGDRTQVVVIDKDLQEAGGGFNILHWRKLYLNRDVTDPNKLDELNLSRCRGFFIVTDNELLNLKVYYYITKRLQAHKDVPMFIRINSTDIIRFMKAEHGYPKGNKPAHRFFDVHVAASGQLFDSININKDVNDGYHKFRAWNRNRIENCIFFGFGRFSAALLSEVMRSKEFSHNVRNVVIVDLNAEEAWRNYVIDHGNPSNLKPQLINSKMESLVSIDYNLEADSHEHTIAVFGSNDESRNMRSAAAFHKLFDKGHRVNYILRTRYKDSFPPEFLQSVLGQEVILIPTFDWIKAYYEDELTGSD